MEDEGRVYAPQDGHDSQIINGDGQITGYLKEFMSSEGLLNRGNDYLVLSVLGCQSSGKSTLLNKLFDLHFDVLDASHGRRQTTRGVCIGRASHPDVSSEVEGGCIVVLDTEGTDSKERGEQNQNFEKKVGLFALAISDILVINLWHQDIGRYTASNYSLLKIVFGLNLQLFQGEETGKSVLLFVVRDHDPSTPLSFLQEQIVEDINKIWEDLEKPDRFKLRAVTDFFHLRFTSLPHKVFQADKFEEAVDQMRSDFFTRAGESSVLEMNQFRKVPADAFEGYCVSLWERILANRDLDIPTQKQIISHFRCNEIIQDLCRDIVKPAAVYLHSSKLGAKEIITEVKAVWTRALDSYHDLTKFYLAEVRESKEEELEHTMDDLFAPIFRTLVGSLVEESIRYFDKQFEVVTQAENPSKVFLSEAEIAKASTMSFFGGLVEDITFEREFFVELVIKSSADLSASVDRNVDLERKNQVQKLVSSLKADCKDKLRAELSVLQSSINVNLWPKVQLACETLSSDALDELAAYSQSFALGLQERRVIQDTLDRCIDECCLTSFRELVRNMPHLLRKSFDDLFKRSSGNVPRSFRNRKEVEAAYTMAKTKAINVLDLLFLFRLKDAYGDLRLFVDSSEPGVLQSPSLQELHQAQERGHILLDQLSISNYFEMLVAHADASLESAMQILDAQEKARSMPWWIFLIIAVLGWNEFIAILSHPIGLAILLLLVAAVIVLRQLPGVATTVALLLRSQGIDASKVAFLFPESARSVFLPEELQQAKAAVSAPNPEASSSQRSDVLCGRAKSMPDVLSPRSKDVDDHSPQDSSPFGAASSSGPSSSSLRRRVGPKNEEKEDTENR